MPGTKSDADGQPVPTFPGEMGVASYDVREWAAEGVRQRRATSLPDAVAMGCERLAVAGRG